MNEATDTALVKKSQGLAPLCWMFCAGCSVLDVLSQMPMLGVLRCVLSALIAAYLICRSSYLKARLCVICPPGLVFWKLDSSA